VSSKNKFAQCARAGCYNDILNGSSNCFPCKLRLHIPMKEVDLQEHVEEVIMTY
jgi:hypothetical protein